jgi:hypothetical protein
MATVFIKLRCEQRSADWIYGSITTSAVRILEKTNILFYTLYPVPNYNKILNK